MPFVSRPIVTDDILSIVELTRAHHSPQDVYTGVELIAAETCGWVLLTTLQFVEAVERRQRWWYELRPSSLRSDNHQNHDQ